MLTTEFMSLVNGEYISAIFRTSTSCTIKAGYAKIENSKLYLNGIETMDLSNVDTVLVGSRNFINLLTGRRFFASVLIHEITR